MDDVIREYKSNFTYTEIANWIKRDPFNFAVNMGEFLVEEPEDNISIQCETADQLFDILDAVDQGRMQIENRLDDIGVYLVTSMIRAGNEGKYEYVFVLNTEDLDE